MYRHAEKLDKRKIKLLSFISFFMGFLQALFLYVMSIYFKEASGTENIGPFYIFSYAVVLFLLLNLHKLTRIIGKANVFYFSLLFKMVTLVLLLMLPPSYLSIGALMLYIVFGTIQWVSLDVILESFSIDNMSGRIRGKQISIVHLGFILAPMLSTYFLAKFGYSSIFLTLFICNAFLFVVALIGFRRVNEKFREDLSVKEFFRRLVRRKNVQRIYYISFVLEFFYALALVYIPLYLINLGMPLEKMGLVFSFMLIPFLILPYPLGILADKKTGEKEMLGISVLILAISMVAIYLIGSKEIWIWGIILFGTRIGAAMLESMRDSYFYKRIASCDMDLINFFRTGRPVAYILSSGIAFLIFIFYPENAIRVIFIVVALVSISALYPIWKLIDNKSENETCTKSN